MEASCCWHQAQRDLERLWPLPPGDQGPQQHQVMGLGHQKVENVMTPLTCLASCFLEPSGSLRCALAPSPPKYPLASRDSRTLGSTELLLRGRRLRALGGLKALRTVEVASGPLAEGQPDTKAAAEAAAGVQGLQHLPPLSPLTPTPAHP